LLQQLWILGGVEEGNDGAVFEFAEFFVGGWTKLCVNVHLMFKKMTMTDSAVERFF
jgi:hypothetical protein